MKLTPTLLLIVCYTFGLSCVSSRRTDTDTLPATALQPYGRFSISKDQRLEMISSGMHVGFSFSGTQCQIAASVSRGHNYLQYELDGVYQKRIKIVADAKEPITITAPAAGKHTVWLYKATEAHTGPVFIQEIKARHIQALSEKKAPLIEFIGNSITCGAAADPSEVPCGSGAYHDQHNAYLAYGPRVARALGAGFVLSSVSGIGVYRNWNSNGPTMPEVYEKVDFQAQNPQRWAFDTFTPQIVSIALGTNDLSNGDGKKVRLAFDSATYVSTYVQFVQLVKTKYPKARVALLSSPMMNGKNRETLQNCLTAVKTTIDAAYPADKPVAVHFFQRMQARGCSGHPNVEDHGVMAQELLPFFKKLMP